MVARFNKLNTFVDIIIYRSYKIKTDAIAVGTIASTRRLRFRVTIIWL